MPYICESIFDFDNAVVKNASNIKSQLSTSSGDNTTIPKIIDGETFVGGYSATELSGMY